MTKARLLIPCVPVLVLLGKAAEVMFYCTSFQIYFVYIVCKQENVQIPLQLIFYSTAHLSFPHDDTEGFRAISWSIEAQTTPHSFQWLHRIPPSVLKDTVTVQSFADTNHTSVNKLACESFHTRGIVWDTRLLKVRPLQV